MVGGVEVCERSMTKTTVICFGWTWQSSELCRLQVPWYSSVLPCMVVITDFLLVTCTVLCGIYYTINMTSQTPELASNVAVGSTSRVSAC